MGRLEPLIGTEILDVDIRLGHTYFEVDVLKNFALSQKYDWFVELGVHEGGLSYLLIPALTPTYRYMGIEITCSFIRQQVMGLYASECARLICGNVFDPAVMSEVRQLSRKIIYCDGGNKAQELRAYKELCQPGDIILCHDFSDGVRRVRGVPDYGKLEFPRPEVLLWHIRHLDRDATFVRLPEEIFAETRIVGWQKINQDYNIDNSVLSARNFEGAYG